MKGRRKEGVKKRRKEEWRRGEEGVVNDVRKRTRLTNIHHSLSPSLSLARASPPPPHLEVVRLLHIVAARLPSNVVE